MQPTTYFVQDSAGVINDLVKGFGPQLQGITRDNKFAILSILTTKLYFNQSALLEISDGEPFKCEDVWIYGGLNYETLDEQESDNIHEAIAALDELSESDALALCEALINQLKFGK